eukprot:TRINITY_DN12986_c0_g1_i1.p1 TRINITY_DN12986_c0_g1~~TRINITY_DN12986_c0_g1_i1.p1  ORF type:complete len:210 (-),score=44.55 TRINITY_DN12986_c0_g1_i1:100-729(-)
MEQPNFDYSDSSSDDEYGDIFRPQLYPTTTPLQNSWTFYFMKPQTGWDLDEIYTFDTVEEFWSLTNNIKRVADLIFRTSYKLFKEEYYPNYSLDCHAHGGRWMVNFNSPSDTRRLELYWMRMILSVIGQTIPEYSEIMGVEAEVRYKGDRLCVWTKNADNAEAQLAIGQFLYDLLENPEIATVEYSKHTDARTSTGNQAQKLYTMPATD